MRNTPWMTLALASLAGLAACGPNEERKAENALSDTGAAVTGAVDAAGNAVENLAVDVKPTPTGQEFADKAAKSDAFEIEAAKLAVTNAQSAGVKDFAKMMITAHTESTAKIKAASGKASPPITPDAVLTEDQKEDVAKLKALKGAEFDKAYIDGQVDAHEEALELMRKYAADGTVPSLKTAAGEIVPAVEKHLAEAKALDKD